jgi:cbb3-type cytochrome oxidase subunit 1
LTSLLQNPVSGYLAVGFVVFDVIALVRMLRRSSSPLVRIPKWYVIGAIVLAVLVFIVRNALMIFYGIDNLDGLALYW